MFVDTKVAETIAAARQMVNPKLTQKDLAIKVNVKPDVIAKLESASGIPDQKLLMHLEKILKVHLRGAKTGEKIEFGKKKDETKEDETKKK